MEFLRTLRAFDAIRDEEERETPDIVTMKTLTATPPQFDETELLGEIDPRLRQALEALGVTRLYEHQARAARQSLEGHDVVLEAPTASGKTLAFLIPSFTALLREPEAHVLMLHPMKALSNDQRRQLIDFEKHIENPGRRLDSWPYNGDTPQHERQVIRQNPPAILMTNPEMLHQSFLGSAKYWNQRFFENLRFIVVDEIHEYRGYFGTHFALLMRRFLNRLAQLGANPQVFLASATCANPKEHAQRLTGRDCLDVRSENRMRPERHFFFINPVGIPDFRYYDIFRARVVNAGLACLSLEYSTLVFCPSRKFAEDAAFQAWQKAEESGLQPNSIKVYRSGLTSTQREQIELGLQEGTYRLVFCTNALELGIDVGRLDVCILAGFPDNTMAAWQRIGRAGRSAESTAYVLFYALNGPVDQFYVENIEAFVNKPLDELTVGVYNDELLRRHLPYLLYESRWDTESLKRQIIGDAFYDCALDAMANANPVAGNGPSYQRLSLRGGSTTIYKLKQGQTEIGTISDTHAFREAFVGAVFKHGGVSYKVEARGASDIMLVPAEPGQRTIPYVYTNIKQDMIFDGARFDQKIAAHYGKLTIFETLQSYRLEGPDGGVIETVEVNNSTTKRPHAFWIEIENLDVLDRDDITSGYRALEQLLRLGCLFVVPSDWHDVGSHSSSSDSVTIYLFENVPGGIGIAQKALSVWRTAIEQGIQIAARCECNDGCPRCIYPPRLRDTVGMSKTAGIRLAQAMLQLTTSGPQERFDQELHGWVPTAAE